VPKIRRIIIDYEKRVVQVEYKKDTLLPPGTFYTPVVAPYPDVNSSDPGFLDFQAQQKESEKWFWIDPQAKSTKKIMDITISFDGFFQYSSEIDKSVSKITYAFDNAPLVSFEEKKNNAK
jgi:hypothetical protein